MTIPIQNIYYLLSYAWNILDKEETTLVGDIPGENIINLLAYLLQKDGALLVKKGLARNYIRQTKTIQGIKGKIEIGASVRDNLFRQGKASCTFEILSPDILPNQIIKAALHKLLLCPTLHLNLRGPLKLILSAFKEVSLIDIKYQDYKAIIATNSFNIYYRRVLPLCELLIQNLLPEEDGQRYLFYSFLEDEQQMGKLFEAFVKNFYAQEQQTFLVKSERINWEVEEEQEVADLQYLPQMKTDISLIAPDKKIIIDTKFYKKALTLHYDKQKLISGHLYQLFAYLKNQTDKINSIEGILLYPVVNQELDLEYKLPGHKVSIKTINLAQPWQNIKADLLRIIA